MSTPKPLCGATNRDGSACRMTAGNRTPHPGIGRCFIHGGCTPTHVAGARKEMIRREVEALGIPYEVDPGEALLGVLFRAAGDVEYLSVRVEELKSEILALETGPGGAVKGVTHPVVVLYGQALDRLALVSAKCLQLGLEERKVRLVETDARRLFGAYAAAVAKVQLPVDLADQLQAAFAAELRDLSISS